jgi:hypothetical protein
VLNGSLLLDNPKILRSQEICLIETTTTPKSLKSQWTRTYLFVPTEEAAQLLVRDAMKPTFRFSLPMVALCFALPGPISAQLAEPIDPVIRSVLMPPTATPASQSTPVWGDVNFTQDGGSALATFAGPTTPNPELAGGTPVAPGTVAKSSPMPLKPGRTSAFSVEPDYLPSWITDQPLAYSRYGAAPAVVTLHFGHK